MPSSRKCSRTSLVCATGAALALVVTTPAVMAAADPAYPSAKQVQDAKAAVAGKAAQVAAVERQLVVSNARLAEVQTAAEVAAERYNGAKVLLQQRTAAARSAAARAAVARKRADVAADRVGQLAAQAYTQGGSLGGLETFLSTNGSQDVADRASGIALAGDIRSRALQDSSATSLVADVLQRQAAQAQAQQMAAAQAAEAARKAAQRQADASAAETARIQREQSALVTQLASLRTTSVVLEQKRQAGLKAEAEARAAAAAKAAAEARAAAERRAAAEAARKQAAARAASEAAAERRRAAEQAAEKAARASHRASTPSTSARHSRPSTHRAAPRPTPKPEALPPTSRGGVSAVVAFARAQLGEMYLWGGEGPDRWDCSGLTMKAWAEAGVYLSHYTGAQWSETRRAPISQRQPGDLVFYGSSGSDSHHVGLYVGGDQMIEAARAGLPVRYASIWRSDVIMEVGRP